MLLTVSEDEEQIFLDIQSYLQSKVSCIDVAIEKMWYCHFQTSKLI